MQPYRITTRAIPRVCKAARPSQRTIFSTPFFPRIGPAGSDFAPLFRLLDDATADLIPTSSRQVTKRTFTPRFDVREVQSAYELQGELPGIEQKDLQIEFVDENTLVIRGRTTHESTQTNEPKAVEAGDANASDQTNNYHKPSVEDEGADAGAESASTGGANTPNTSSGTEVAEQQSKDVAASQPNFKYWISERSVGEFERRFSFPGRVDQDAVKASLKNGILSVVVPKIMAREARKINIE